MFCWFKHLIKTTGCLTFSLTTKIMTNLYVLLRHTLQEVNESVATTGQ